MNVWCNSLYKDFWKYKMANQNFDCGLFICMLIKVESMIIKQLDFGCF
jgi:hypothetical protein